MTLYYTKGANSSNTLDLLDDMLRLNCASVTKQTLITDFSNDSSTPI